MIKAKSVKMIVTALVLLNTISSAYAFRDVDNETENAAEEFIDSGMFESFIFKYGDSMFRPEGNVSRSDLLLVLKEYYIVMERLLGQNRQILSKLENVEEDGLSSSDVDMVLREFQKNLEPMLRASATIKKMESKTPGGASGESISNISNELEMFSSKLYEIEKKVARAAEKEDLSTVEKEINSLKKDLKRFDEVIKRAGRKQEEEAFRPAVSQAGNFVFPFWARVSLGFSVMTLFFMSR